MVYYVFGHKNPDTDSICSAIVYTNYLKSHGFGSEVIKLGSFNNETKFVLEKFNVDFPRTQKELPAGSQVVLMDHNEKSQTIDGIETMEIVEVIDHHKFNLVTNSPIKIRAEPLGSCCTIVAKILFEEGMSVSVEEASLLISGIISDTLFFRSPTSTTEDKDIMNKLNEIARIEDLEAYSLEMFNAKSDLGDMSIDELVKLDYKVFDFSGKKFGIGVMETTNPEYGLGREEEIVSELVKVKSEDGLDCAFLSVVDILNEKNTTIFPSVDEEKLLKEVFDAKIEGNLAHLGAVLSRKKQVAPAIEKSVNS